MRINTVKDREANVTLDAEELVILGNIMHFYEHRCSIDPDCSKPTPKFHELAAQVITARDLSQYGHLDSFSLGSVMRHKLAANPKSRLAGQIAEMAKHQSEIDLAQYYPSKPITPKEGDASL